MKITLDLMRPSFDGDNLSEDLKKQFDNSCQLYVFKNEDDYADDNEHHLFSVWVEYGREGYAMMFYADLNDLEMFANAITKSIEMSRRDFSKVIKDKIKYGHSL